VSVVAELVDELLDVLVHHRVDGDVVPPHVEVSLVGQLALDDEVGGLEEGALFGEFLDGVAAVAQDAALTVDVGDLALARRRVGERRVVAHQAGIVGRGFDLAQIRGADGVVLDGNLVLLAGAVVDDRQRVFRHGLPLSRAHYAAARVPINAAA